MKLTVASLLIVTGAQAFAPSRFGGRAVTARAFGGLDHAAFQDLPHHIHSLQSAFSTLNLADAVADLPLPDAAAADSVVDAAAAGSGNGWFGFLEAPIEALLQICHNALVSMGLTENSWGISILLMTTLIKFLTFPLTKTQLESTNKMQALQPKLKEVQNKYQSNPDVMNQKIADLYKENEVNPLAGCLPSFLQIPIFIGLYRAVLTLAKDGKLDEPFLFLPSLEGPTYGADPTHGSDWILKGWENGVPTLGWEQTAAFMVLPIVLVLSQFISMELMQPQPGPDGTKPESPFVLKFLPLMIGWFSLNVPSALGIYWVANNIITTSTTLLIRSQMKPVTVSASSSSPPSPSASIFAAPPMRKASWI
ncbi:60Kd inner membrane protein [Fragilaria crotonensis]|nr:60Kd inner membrane protein [Fragilaria crotonensis]